MKRLPKRVYAACIVLLGPILFSIVGLQRYQKTWILLNRIDAVIETEPAQALHLLDSLDRSQLYDAAQRAKFALLYTQAQDKNYIDETNDSLIRVAVDYYEQHRNLRDKFRSLYYLGRVRFNQGEYSRAMISYMEAEQLKKSIESDAALGLLYSQMGAIYRIYYDYPKALTAFKQAYHHYQQAGLSSYQNFAMIDVGMIYRHMKQYELSEECFNDILKVANIQSDTLLIAYCCGNLIIQYNEQEKYDRAFQLYKYVIDLGGEHYIMSSTYTASVACMWAYMNNFEYSHNYFELARSQTKNNIDSSNLHYFTAKILRKTQDYEEAYSNLRKSFRLQDSVLRQVLQQPILSTQRDFLANKLEYQAYKAQTERRFRYYYISIAVLVFLFLCSFMFYRLKCKDAMIDRWMMMYHNLEETSSLYRAEAREKMDNLFKEQFSTINELAKIYYMESADSKRQESLFREIKRQLEVAKSSQKLKELEAIVNEYRFDAMRLLREEFPQLKARDYRELCYHFAGFGIPLVSVMMNDNQHNIYTRRLRYRNRFAKSNAPHRELFIHILGVRDKESVE